MLGAFSVLLLGGRFSAVASGVSAEMLTGIMGKRSAVSVASVHLHTHGAEFKIVVLKRGLQLKQVGLDQRADFSRFRHDPHLDLVSLQNQINLHASKFLRFQLKYRLLTALGDVGSNLSSHLLNDSNRACGTKLGK
jgi:hypothetical protein